MGNLRLIRSALLLIAIGCVTACSLDGIVSVDDPEGGVRELDHNSVKSKAGAIGMYRSSLASLRTAVSALSLEVALFTDEVQVIPFHEGRRGTGTHTEAKDARMNTSADFLGNREVRFDGDFYQHVNAARIQAIQARTLLREYGDSSSQSLLANAYSIEAYAILFLAENGCSGIPLTFIPFEGTVEYTAGYTTNELFNRAITLFDSAMTIAHDSLHFYTLARVGSARAHLGIGNFENAASAVADVDISSPPFTFSYSDAFTPGGAFQESAFWTMISGPAPLVDALYIENNEGVNGMVWLAPAGIPQDPRVPVVSAPPTPSLASPLRQSKFVGGAPTLTLASWIDASMVRAEAALDQHALGGTEWLVPINEARRSVGLSDTTDPGTDKNRIDLLFKERAYWSYLTGARLGDLRRLVRQYGRLPHEVYPVGDYTKSNSSSTARILFYGDHFVFSPPRTEVQYNYKYDGCDHFNP